MTVYLIGDSIRMNAELHVRNLLSGLSVRSPAENCEHSRKVRANVGAWVPAVDGDVVHLNCGLHDIRFDDGSTVHVCELVEYEANLTAIFEALTRTGASLIWATSTPFDEFQHNAAKKSRRYVRELRAYNDASVRIAKAHGAEVNDLHAKVSRHCLGDVLLPDGLHFNAAGNAVVGAYIAEAIVAAKSKHGVRALADS